MKRKEEKFSMNHNIPNEKCYAGHYDVVNNDPVNVYYP